MTYAANLEQLRSTVEMLQHAYDQARAELENDYWTPEMPYDVLRCRTTDGRYILLDALTALVQAQTVIVQAETVNSGKEEL
ncbi:hypothetical protein Rhe02_54710 [Rhizocola hellebori]|uniref:Uncharacterized protein n=1 Tax=Rhizocola hellebori TaxID=1392758 RepID=A0A8J3VHH2_9ACTN|nr:hypothetical protein [Rhizocola hellebori]GIH07404.1 hypothetical protein Rhe02_54710 [Rhizocola hellebori]